MSQPPGKNDLSNPIDESIPTWPTFERVQCEQTDWAARDGFTMERVDMASHTATRVDSPLHFIPKGKTLDDFSSDEFMREGVILNLSQRDNQITIDESKLREFDAEIQANDVVMLHTRWDQYYGRTPEYLFEFPHLSGDTSQYLAEQAVKAVGIDTPGVGGWVDEVPAHGPSTEIQPDESHLPLLENDVIPIEELRNLNQVLDGRASRRAYFCFPSLNFHGTSGGSVCAFALL